MRHPSSVPSDHLFWSSPGAGVAALWQDDQGTVGDLLRAAAVANEICGRVAASWLLHPCDLDLGGLFAEIALSVRAGQEPDLSRVELGPLPVGGGLGSTWLTPCLGLTLTPVHLLQRVAVEATAEILRRHRTAADKPLRPDQWKRCTVRVPIWTLRAELNSNGSLETSIARALGVLAVEQELPAAAWHPDWWSGARGDAAEAVTACIDVVHDPSFSVEVLEHVARSGLCDRAQLVAATLDLPDGWSGPQWVEVLRVNAHRLLLASGGGDLSGFDAKAFRTVLPVEIEIETIRGGVWAERRHLPEGSPGWFPEDTEKRVLALRAAGDEELAQRPSDLPDDAPASEWIALL